MGAAQNCAFKPSFFSKIVSVKMNAVKTTAEKKGRESKYFQRKLLRYSKRSFSNFALIPFT